MNLDPAPFNGEAVDSTKKFTAPWLRSLNQLYAAVKSFLGGGLTLGTGSTGIALGGTWPNQWITGSGGGGGGGITQLTGDVLAAGTGSVIATLKPISGVAGIYSDANITVDGNGRVTAAASGSAITSLTGDGTATGPGAAALTLATVNGNVGTFVNSTFTVNAKGLITAASNGSGSVPAVTFNKQTVSYTLVLADVSLSTPTMVQMNLAGANTLTVAKNSTTAYPIGVTVGWQQYGSGQTTLTPAAGVTFRTSGSLTSRTQYSSGTMIQLATDEWLIEGDTS